MPTNGVSGVQDQAAAAVATGVDFPVILLTCVVFGTAVIALIALFLPDRTEEQRGRIRLMGLWGSGLALLLTLAAVNIQINEIQGGARAAYEEQRALISAFSIVMQYHLTADGITLPLLLLSTGTFVSVAFASWKYSERVKSRCVLLLLLETGVTGVLCASDYMLFLLFWGLQTVVLAVFVGMWAGGYRRRLMTRSLARGVTAFSLMTAGIVLMVVQAGQHTSDLVTVNAQHLPTAAHAACFWLLLGAFLVALPIPPLWRDNVDVAAESPAPIMALGMGIITMLSGYGLLRVVLGAFPDMVHTYSPIIGGLGVLCMGWVLLAMRAEHDIRRVVAYSSAVAIGPVLLALAVPTSNALVGAVLIMVSFGLTAALLSLLSGILEDRIKAKQIAKFGGLGYQMPRLTAFWLVAILSVAGLPLLAGFSAEVMTLTGTYAQHRVMTALVVAGIALNGIYLLTLTRRIFFGEMREEYARVKDITTLELTYALPLLIGILLFGILPGRVIPLIVTGVSQLVGSTT